MTRSFLSLADAEDFCEVMGLPLAVISIRHIVWRSGSPRVTYIVRLP